MVVAPGTGRWVYLYEEVGSMNRRTLRPDVIVTLILLALLLSVSTVAASTYHRWVPVQPTPEQTEIIITTSGGITAATVRFTFPNSGYRVTWAEQVARNGNNFAVGVAVEAYTGPSLTVITTFEKTYTLGALPPGKYTFSVISRNGVVETQPFTIV
jgi:hypothetical protein